jgi:transposase InsO family protein
VFESLEEDPPQLTDILNRLEDSQEKHKDLMKLWAKQHGIIFYHEVTHHLNAQFWSKDRKRAVPPDDDLRRAILQYLHDTPTAGHPGRDETTMAVARQFWWPGMRTWVEEYVKGCAQCQQSKNLTHKRKTPLYRIPVPPEAKPFEVVAMDLITQLPKSGGHDAILTIVDHGCSRAAVFVPCSTAISGEGVAKLYLTHVYQWFGLPNKIISDHDPRFTSKFAKAICEQLQIKQNISTAFHPQTDGLSERKNQWVEQYLRLVANARQDDWSAWLPLATAIHNARLNTTTKVTPFQTLLGYNPNLKGEPSLLSTNQLATDRQQEAKSFRAQAREALNQTAQARPEQQYAVGDQVWLEAKNLALAYQMPKLAPKRHGPFTITKAVSPVAYQLELPKTWTIHDIFHASLLTPYRETRAHGPNFTRPSPELIGRNEEYEVENVLGH